MSLYNMLFGRSPLSAILLGALDLTPEAVGRFRDAWLDGETIAIHTRLGGGNRECWCAEGDEHHCYTNTIEALQAHPNYLRDVDEEYDCTYATFFFSFPEHFKAELTALAANTEPVNPGERWQQLFAALESST